MEITATGKNLDVMISCDYLKHHHWMSFLCYYSFKYNMPDAKIHVASPRKIMYFNLFDWARKCRVPLFLHKDVNNLEQIDLYLKKFNSENLLVVNPDTLCVRTFEEANYDPNALQKKINIVDETLCTDCRSENQTLLASYQNGWGNFNLPLWINKQGFPLLPELKYSRSQMTSNEMRISKIWQSASKIFISL